MQSGSRGKMSLHRLFGITELGFRDPEANLDGLIRAFVSIGEAAAARWIQMPTAVLVFQVVPGDPASGAIYVYERHTQSFYMLTFEGADDNLSLSDFDQVLTEYQLLDCVWGAAFARSNFEFGEAA